jgi:ATP-dependent helicase/nuclease subunit A
VQDLLALTRALHHLGDRISWFALLRSPYCGLSLSDLYHITQFSDEKIATPTIWKQLQHYEKIPLSTATKQRLSRLVPILQQSLQQQGRIPLPLWVKQTWLQLGGPTSLLHWDDMRHIDAFLNFLTNKIKLEGEHFDFFKVTDELNNIYTQTTAHASAHLVDIMTIHQAKGLEYDHVILPGLHRRGRVESSPLLLYSEKMREQQRKDFLLAPIKASHEEQDLIYNYLFSEEKKKSDAELTRLLYVACTRAKKSLHLFATLSLDEKGSVKPPAPLSLFSHLWPVLHIQAEDLLTCTSAQTTTLLPAQGLLKRLPADWQAPIPNQIDINPGITSHAYAYHWQLHPERILGTVIHRLLYQISQDGITHWNREKISAASTMFAQLLAQNGLLEPQIAEALVKLNTCLTKTLSDERGRWILNPQHRSAQSEFAVTAVLNGQVQSLVMDRSFIDTDTGIRWIIDYKTTDYQGNTPEDFLKAERQQHQEQLNTYAQALLLDAELCGSQTLRCGLYLPLTSLWCEWEFTEASVAESIQG